MLPPVLKRTSPPAAGASAFQRTVSFAGCRLVDTMCAGVTAAKGRVPYLIFMLLDVLRAFPGQVRRRMTGAAGFRLYLLESDQPRRARHHLPVPVLPGSPDFAPIYCEPSAGPNVSAGIPMFKHPCVKAHYDVLGLPTCAIFDRLTFSGLTSLQLSAGAGRIGEIPHATQSFASGAAAMPVHLLHVFIYSVQLVSCPNIPCELLQVPDVSAVVQASDFPCVKAARDTPDTEFRSAWQQLPPEHFDGRPIPVFGYNRRDGFMDLLFPDFTYFGHEYSQITGAALKMCSDVRIFQEAHLHLRSVHACAYAAARLLPVHLHRFLLPPPEVLRCLKLAAKERQTHAEQPAPC